MLCILENVKGLLRVWAQIHAVLKRVGPYLIAVIKMSPVQVGAPVPRNRLYIILLHRHDT